MSSSLLIALKMTGVLGAVLALGFYELWSLQRDKARDEKSNAEPDKAKDETPQK